MAGDKVTAVEETLALAKELRHEKRYDEAAEMLLDTLQFGIQTDRIFFQLGNIFVDRGDLSRAEYSYRRATEENPEHINALHNLAVVYKRRGKVADAVKLQRRVMLLELRRGPQGEKALPPDAARWARKVSLQGFLIVGLTFALLVWWLYL